jgi:hypothetical protein
MAKRASLTASAQADYRLDETTVPVRLDMRLAGRIAITGSGHKCERLRH